MSKTKRDRDSTKAEEENPLQAVNHLPCSLMLPNHRKRPKYPLPGISIRRHWGNAACSIVFFLFPSLPRRILRDDFKYLNTYATSDSGAS